MTEKTVNTIAGPFDRKRYKALCDTLDQAEKDGIDRDQVIKFEGNDLLVSFGGYLREFLDSTFAQRNHAGL